MIISNQKNEQGKWAVCPADALTKQQIADGEIHNVLPLKLVTLVAASEMENVAGWYVEDSEGNVHIVAYMNYLRNGIKDLMLPPIQFPQPSMSVADALNVVWLFAEEWVEKHDSNEDAVLLPKEFVQARQVLGGYEKGQELFKTIVEAIKVKKQAK